MMQILIKSRYYRVDTIYLIFTGVFYNPPRLNFKTTQLIEINLVDSNNTLSYVETTELAAIDVYGSHLHYK